MYNKGVFRNLKKCKNHKNNVYKLTTSTKNKGLTRTLDIIGPWRHVTPGPEKPWSWVLTRSESETSLNASTVCWCWHWWSKWLNECSCCFECSSVWICIVMCQWGVLTETSIITVWFLCVCVGGGLRGLRGLWTHGWCAHPCFWCHRWRMRRH